MFLIEPYLGLPWPIYRHLWWEDHGGNGDLTQCQEMIVEANLASHNPETAEMLLSDWRGSPSWPHCTVSKFQPGEHFHVLGEKFATFELAAKYARGKGYIVDGLKIVHVYNRSGD